MKRLSICFLFLTSMLTSLCALNNSPWLGNLGELYIKPFYQYRYYPDVEGGFNPIDYSSHDQVLGFDLGGRFLPSIEAEFELETDHTRKLDWGLLSTAFQVRYSILDDIAGDFISMTALASLRFAPSRVLRDVSTPYHAHVNGEIGLALGKEFDKVSEWIIRFFGLTALGQANRGHPWLRYQAGMEANVQYTHHFGLINRGYFGFGDNDRVNINEFRGYANINHSSIELGAFYCYAFKIWGVLSAEYNYRFYAKAYPERASTLLFSYTFPFSIF